MATLNEELNFWLGVTHKLFIVKFMYLLKNKHKKRKRNLRICILNREKYVDFLY